MSKLAGHGSAPARVNVGGVLRWEYRLGQILEVGLDVALLAPGTGQSAAAPTLVASPDPLLERGTSDRLEARALGRWEWEGGLTD